MNDLQKLIAALRKDTIHEAMLQGQEEEAQENWVDFLGPETQQVFLELGLITEKSEWLQP